MPRRSVIVCFALALVPVARAHAQDWLRPSLVHDGFWRGRAPYLPSHFEAIKALGVRTIIDLRGNQVVASAVERKMAARHGLEYRKVPLSFHPLKDGSGDDVLAVFQDRSAYPIYVHCNLDRDRTSAAIGVYRIKVCGWTQQAAEAEAHEFRNPPVLHWVESIPAFRRQVNLVLTLQWQVQYRER